MCPGSRNNRIRRLSEPRGSAVIVTTKPVTPVIVRLDTVVPNANSDASVICPVISPRYQHKTIRLTAFHSVLLQYHLQWSWQVRECWIESRVLRVRLWHALEGCSLWCPRSKCLWSGFLAFAQRSTLHMLPWWSLCRTSQRIWIPLPLCEWVDWRALWNAFYTSESIKLVLPIDNPRKFQVRIRGCRCVLGPSQNAFRFSISTFTSIVFWIILVKRSGFECLRHYHTLHIHGWVAIIACTMLKSYTFVHHSPKWLDRVMLHHMCYKCKMSFNTSNLVAKLITSNVL